MTAEKRFSITSLTKTKYIFLSEKKLIESFKQQVFFSESLAKHSKKCKNLPKYIMSLFQRY